MGIIAVRVRKDRGVTASGSGRSISLDKTLNFGGRSNSKWKEGLLPLSLSLLFLNSGEDKHNRRIQLRKGD
jgi:hypothetical protein